METTVRSNNRYEILTPSGWSEFVGIKKLSPERVLNLTNGQESITCTPSHWIKLANGDFKEAIHVTPWDELEGVSGSLSGFDITTIAAEPVYDPVYVHEKHEYYSGPLVSHNCMQFLGSSGTLIAGWKLKEMVWRVPAYEKEGFRKYRDAEKGHSYVLCADVSEGKGLDYSAFSVIDVTRMPYEQVCSFRSNQLGATDYASEIFQAARYYNSASILIETNIALGPEVAGIIHSDFEYENVLYTASNGANGRKLSSGFGDQNVEAGLRSTVKTKATGCSVLKMLVEGNQLIVNDFHTYQEFTTFSRDPTKAVKSAWCAEKGHHDDCVMALVVFAWLSTQNYFSQLTDIHTLHNLREKTDEELMNEVMPFGFISNGIPEEETIEPLFPATYTWG